MITKFNKFNKLTEGYTFSNEEINILKSGLEYHYHDKDRITDDIEYFQSLLSEDKIKLYRVLFLPDIKFLDESEFGEHWTMDKSTITNYINTLRDNGIETFWQDYDGDEDYQKDDFKNYLISAETDISNIDIELTLSNFVEFPYEVEAEIKDKNKIKIESIEEYSE